MWMNGIEVGTLVKLSTPCLGNEAGSTGVCYEVYKIGERPGYAFIFENGRYDGFSPDEVTNFLEELGYWGHLNYEFSNVIKLGEDFTSGRFDEAFSEAVYLND